MRVKATGIVVLAALGMALGMGLCAAPAGAAGPDPSSPYPAGAVDTSRPYYFYHGLRYGSESLVHPVRLIVNGGFGILQLDNRDNRLGRVDYRTGLSNVARNLAHPIRAIETVGWRTFIQSEILPVTFSRGEAYYWPNYTQHLIGGGMSYRMMSEWFRYRGQSHPDLWAAGTITVYHLLNEVVENDGFVGYRTDPIADLYVFDPLSIALFRSDRVARFFGETLHMADWSYQPSFDPFRGSLENHGQNFALKWGLPGSSRLSLFYHYGTHGEFGLSWRRDNGDSFSFGTGAQAKNLLPGNSGNTSVDLGAALGLFYDRNNSLMASLLMARTKDYRVRLNIYPGFVRFGPVAPGFFAGLMHEGGAVVGFNVSGVPGCPLGLARGTAGGEEGK
jgi:hypothetical protein